MSNSIFNEGILPILPDVKGLNGKTRELNTMLEEVISNYHSFECDLNKESHGEVVSLRKELLILAANINDLIKLFEQETDIARE